MDLERYERFGWDYRRWNPPDERARAWYREHERHADGPILELACGTGHCRARWPGTAMSSASIFATRCWTDVRAGRPGRQLAARTRNVRRHARVPAPGSRPPSRRRAVHRRPSLLSAGAVRRWRPGVAVVGAVPKPRHRRSDPAQGLRRRVTARLDPAAMVLHGVFHYEVTRPDRSIESAELPFQTDALRTEDYVRMFGEAGFAARIGFDYGEGCSDGEVLCVVAGVSA